MNESRSIINQNFPHNSEYSDESFLGYLHEKETWIENKYWELDKAIYSLSNEFNGENIPRDIAWPLMRIYSHTITLLLSHHSKNDGYTIKNLDDLAVQEYRERIQLVVEGFFQNKMPKNQHFEKVNPLL